MSQSRNHHRGSGNIIKDDDYIEGSPSQAYDAKNLPFQNSDAWMWSPPPTDDDDDDCFPSDSDSDDPVSMINYSQPTTHTQQPHSHHTMTKIVFIHKILPFAANKKESSAIFKSVSSSWDETVVHYSGPLLFFWKLYIESQEKLRREKHDDGNSSAQAPPRNCVALEVLLRGLRRWPCFPWLPIETLFDVCDLFGAQFTEENEVHLGLDKHSPFEMLLCYRGKEGCCKADGKIMIHSLKRLLKLFGDHENNKCETPERANSASDEQQTKNNFMEKVLRSTKLLAFATGLVSIEVIKFLVRSIFNRIGGWDLLFDQLKPSASAKRNTVLDEALAWGDLEKLKYFVGLLTGTRVHPSWFLDICNYFNKSTDASLLGAMCHYPLAKKEHAQFLIEKIRSEGGHEEVKKQLEWHPWTGMQQLKSRYFRCSIHFACQHGNREKLQYVFELAKGFGKEYFKQFIVLRAISYSMPYELPPLHYALRNNTEGSEDTLEYYVEELVAHVGVTAVVQQVDTIRKRCCAGLHAPEFKPKNVECLCQMMRQRGIRVSLSSV